MNNKVFDLLCFRFWAATLKIDLKEVEKPHSAEYVSYTV